MQPGLSRRALLGLSALVPGLARAATPTAPLDLKGNKITWLGFSTVRLDTAEGKTFLIDPWLTFDGCPLRVEDFPTLDGILITHGHWQHVGETLALHAKTKAPVIAVEEISAWLRNQGVTVAPKVNLGGTVTLGGGVKVSVTAAVHSSGLLEKDGGYISYGGDPAGFVVHLPGDVRVYHAGDTDVFGDMALIKSRWAPQVGLLPVGDITTMGPDAAALACGLLGLKVAIPIHYDLPGFTGTPQAFEAALKARKVATRVVVAQRGIALA